jgi:hypothetical protein
MGTASDHQVMETVEVEIFSDRSRNLHDWVETGRSGILVACPQNESFGFAGSLLQPAQGGV